MKHEYTEGCLQTSLLINNVDVRNLPIDVLKNAILEIVNNETDKSVLIDFWCNMVELTGDYEDLGECSQCGDYISKYTLNIE